MDEQRRGRCRSNSGGTNEPLPSARLRNCILYGMKLNEEVHYSGWVMQVDRAGLMAAVGGMHGRAILTVSERGLSVRSGRSRTEVAAHGLWASPIAVDCARLRRVLAKLPRDDVDLGFTNGRLTLDERRMAAREV